MINVKKHCDQLTTITNYEFLKSSVENNGEVMIRLVADEEFELHKHNAKFEDNTKK